MNKQHLSGWLDLVFYRNLSSEQIFRLLEQIGLPNEIFQSNYLTLKAVVGDETAQRLRAPMSSKAQEQISEVLAWERSTPRARIVTLDDPLYPKSLLVNGVIPLVFLSEES